MRATINFETNVDEILNVMFSLMGLEAERLHDTANALYEADDTSAISILDRAVQDTQLAYLQLQQYRDMLLSFEKARFETRLPQPAGGHVVESLAAVQDTAQKMQQFDTFLSKIQAAEGTGDDPEEG